MSEKFDWGTIKFEITRDCENAFRDQNLSISRDEIDRAMIVFGNLINLKIDYFEIADLGKRMKHGLQECYVSRLGDINSLLIFAASIESFLKVLILQAGLSPYNVIKNQDKTLIPLARITGVFGQNATHPFRNLTRNQYDQDPNGCFLLARSYEARNTDIHNTPAWDRATVASYLKYILATEIFCIHRLYSTLTSLHPELTEKAESKDVSSADLQAYDLISFGKSAGDYKNRILQASIIHMLNGGDHNETEIIQSAETQFGNKMRSGVKKAIQRLLDDHKISDINSPFYGLTETEKDRISRIREDFGCNRELLRDSIQECVKGSLLEGHLDEVFNELTAFWDEYLLSNGNQEVSDEYNLTQSGLWTLINQHSACEEDATQLIHKLIRICRDNDCLKQKSFGKACSLLLCRKDYALAQGHRRIWFDTQIALYLLAMPTDDYMPPADPLFRSIWDMDHIILNQESLLPCIAQIYRHEITNHVKEALSLCHFEECSWFIDRTPSNNVFYRYYVRALDEGLLPIGIETFSDYLQDILEVKPEDLDEENVDSILDYYVTKAIETKGIKFEKIPEPDKLKDAIGVFEQEIRTKQLRPKKDIPLKNDAWMGAYLFEKDEIPSPIFVTLDKTFPPFRSKYIDLYRRCNLSTWQIYSPSRLVNQLELMNMEFNPETIDDGILLLVESETSGTEMKQLLDIVIRLTNNKWTSNSVRQKRQERLLAKFYHKEFENIDSEDEVNMEYTTKFVDSWDKLINHYNNIDMTRDNNFFQMIKEDEVFESVIELVYDHIQQDNKTFDELLNGLSEFFASREATLAIEGLDAINNTNPDEAVDPSQESSSRQESSM